MGALVYQFCLAVMKPSKFCGASREDRLSVCNQRYRTRLSRLRRQSKCQSAQRPSKAKVIEMVSHHVSGGTLDFIKAQIMLSGRAAKGHRYSHKYKMFALTLYHASPKCYKMLRKVFGLPGISTLKVMMKCIDINPDFHAAVLQGLRMKTESMHPTSKLCAIVFDEMSVTSSNLVLYS